MGVADDPLGWPSTVGRNTVGTGPTEGVAAGATRTLVVAVGGGTAVISPSTVVGPTVGAIGPSCGVCATTTGMAGC